MWKWKLHKYENEENKNSLENTANNSVIVGGN